jgi:Trk-type K+ transport system membrane component
MGVMAFAFMIGMVLWLEERQRKQHMRRDQRCENCDQMVRYRPRRNAEFEWVHISTGTTWYPPRVMPEAGPWREAFNKAVTGWDYSKGRIPHPAAPSAILHGDY